MVWYDRWSGKWWLIPQTWDTWGPLLGRRKVMSSGHQVISDPVATGKRWGQELIMQNAALLYGEAGNVEERGFLCLNGILMGFNGIRV